MEHIARTAAEFMSALDAASTGERIIVEGRLKLSEPIRLEGRKGLSFVGREGAALDFMRPVGDFAESELRGVRVWTAEIPDDLAELKPYAAFSVGGEPLNRPRLPKSGFYRVKGCPDFDMMAAGQREHQTSMYFGEGEVPVMEYPGVAQIRAFHWWTDELLYIDSIDYAGRVIRFKNPPVFTMKCENSKTEGARWYLDNVFEALSEPGEYFITPDCRRIYYVPRPGEEIGRFQIYLSTSEKIMELSDCGDISFEGVEFKGSDRDKLHLIRKFSQAALDVPCAIELDGCANVSFTGCRFADIGLSCVGIDKGSHDINFKSCEFAGVGGNPIHIKGRNLTHDEWQTTYPGGHFKNDIAPDIQHGINVIGCHIHDYGRIYFNACGILLRYAYDCDLSDNEIHDGYYTGISVGWVWGYAAHATNHIRIERNHIYRIGKALLSDMGGIYTLGQQEGTVIRQNRVHDIEMDSYGGWGIYLDEGSSDILVEENIAYDLSAQPFHQHYGSNNLLRKNIFAFGEGGAFIVTRKEEHLSVILERNILVSDGTPIYAKSAEQFNITDCMNLVWNYSGDALSGAMNYDVYTRTYSFPPENRRTPDDMRAGGLFNGVIIADPQFRSPSTRDFTLLPGSPAEKLGF